jgi:hypothetical protein
VNATSSDTCLSCPVFDGVICSEGTIVPYVGRGYYRTLDQPALVTICYPPEACDAAEFSNTTCATLYTGDRCSMCSSDAFRNSGKCIKCLAAAIRRLILAALIMLVFAALALLSQVQNRIPHSFTLFLFWVQFLSIFPSLSNSWPPVLFNFLNFSKIFNIDFGYIGLGCEVSSNSYVTVLQLKIVAPLLFTVILASKNIGMVFAGRIEYIPWHTIFSHSMFILRFFSVQLFSSLLQVFRCVDSGDGSGVLSLYDESSIKCGDPTWNQLVSFNVVFIILYLLVVPGTLAGYYFYCKRNQSIDQFNSFVGPMKLAYSPGKGWFEIVKISSNFVVVLIRDVLTISSVSRIFFIEVWLLFFLWLQNQVRPYSETKPAHISIL